MALFKIFNNIDSKNTTLPSTYTKGYMYYDALNSIFYIDVAGEGGSTGIRQKINAYASEFAVKDEKGLNINSTYIKDVSIAGTSLTITKGDNTTATYTLQDTWKLNSKTSEGYVSAGNGQNNKVWGTDAQGNPGWQNKVASSLQGKLTFGAGQEYVFDGSTDLTVPVYTGTNA